LSTSYSILDILDLLRNTPFIVGVVSFLTAQTMKVIIKRDLKYFFSYGGMPSGHTATVTGLTWSIARCLGFSSPVTALSAIFLIIIMMDSVKLRPAVKKSLGHNWLEAFVGFLIGTFIAHIFPAKLTLW